MKISHLVFGLLGVVALFFIGHAIAILPIKITLALIIGFIFSILTIMNVEIGLFLLIFVVPFTHQITLAKVGYTPIDIGTDDFLIICILISWLAGLARRKEPLFLKTSLNWPIFAFFTAAIFSFIGAYIRFGQGAILVSMLHLFKFFEYVAIYFIVVSSINNLDQIKKFIIMYFITAGLVVIMHFYAVFKIGQFNLSALQQTSIYISAAVASLRTFQSNAILGAYHAFFLSILLAFLLSKSVFDNAKVFLFLFALVLSFALFNSFSRSAYAGFIVACLLLTILKERRLFVIILLLVIFSPIYLQSAVLERIILTIQSIDPLTFDFSTLVRLTIWKRGLLALLYSPIFGTGYWTTRWVLDAEAHSQYLALLIETGIVGFSVFCWLIVRMFKNAVVLMKKTNVAFLNALATGYIAGLAALLTASFFSDTLEAFRIIGPLWFITGLVTSANRLSSKETEEGGISKDQG